MLDINIKEIIKKLFNELFTNDKERKEINDEIKSYLKTNKEISEEYQKLIDEKKAIDNKIKDFMSNNPKLFELKKQSETLNNQNYLIKKDISKKLECQGNIVSDLYKYFKRKFIGKNDELREIAEKWVEVFEN